MLANIINQFSPEIIADAIRKNPYVVLNVLQKFDTFKAFASAMSVDQQIFLSNNLQYVTEFLNSKTGQEYISISIDAFKEFVEENNT